MARGRQRRIEHPTTAKSRVSTLTGDDHGKCAQSKGEWQKPEGDVVHAWEGHVWRANLQRHEPVTKATNHRRHNHEEDHDQAVHGDNHVIIMGIAPRALRSWVASDTKILQAGFHQFHPDHAGQRATKNPRENREDQIHGANVFVVGRQKPTHGIEDRWAVAQIRHRGGFKMSSSACHVQYVPEI